MNKKLIALLLTLVFCLCLAVPCLAQSDLLIDNAGLLTSEEADTVRSQLKALSDEYDMDIVIVTIDEYINYDIGTYADDYFDDNGYGRGDDRDGILLMINMAESEWYVSTCGYAAYALPEDYIDEIAYDFVPYLSSREYETAFSAFIDGCRYYLADDMGSYDDYFEHRDDFDADDFYYESTHHDSSRSSPDPLWIPIAIAIGLVIAFISMTVMKSGMKTVKMRNAASDYVRRDSFRLTENSDLFLYRTVSRTRKPDNDDNHGNGAGGHFSNVHMSSGGSIHGGHGGKF